MLRLIIFLLLAVVLKQSRGKEELGEAIEPSEEEKELIVGMHNAIRSGVEPTARNMLKMVWSTDASKKAKKWAEKCSSRVGSKKQRKVKGIECGQNIMFTKRFSAWTNAIESWFRPADNFHYGLGAINKRKSISSYIQMIWFNAHHLGCAVAYCPHKELPYLYLCNYCPSRQKMISQTAKPYKTGLPCEDCPGYCEDNLCTNPCKYVDKEDYCKSLIKMMSCKNREVKKKCKATCKCNSKII